MNLLSEHNRILRVGEGGSQEYFAGPNINITDHVISGKYWDNEINSAISSTSGDIVNEAFNQSTAWTEEQGYLTAHQDVSNLPYVQNSALEFSPQGLISGISGSGLYAVSAEGALTADTAYFAYNAEHADSADYVESAQVAEFATSSLSSNRADVANYAFSADIVINGWEYDETSAITAYNGSAFKVGQAGDYSGISPIVVDNEQRIISAESARLGVQNPLYFVEDSNTATVIGIHDSAFPTFEGTPEGKISAINGSALNADPVIDYSAGNNIDITDHVISVTGSVPSADRASYAVSATSSHYSHSAIEAASANSATYDNLGREITATYLTAVTGDNTPYSAGANIVINDHVIGLDTAVELTNIPGNRGTILDASGLYVSDLDQSDYTEIGLDHVFSTDGSARIGWQLGNKEISVSDDSGNGDYAILHMSTADVMLEQRHPEPTPDAVYSLTGACQSAVSAINMINSGDNQAYSAGANIDITNHVVSGKDWTTEIQNASSYAVDQATAQIPDVTNLPYVQNTALNITNGSITSISSYSVGHSQVPVSGESGIYLTKKNGTVYIGYSGEGGGGGADYEGVAPIVVNNVEHKISAQSAVLGVQEPLYFVEDSETATIIGISGLPEVEGVMYESALGKSDNKITGYNGTAFSANATGKYIPYTNITTGDSGTTVYNVASGIRVTAASGWTEMYNQNKENANEAHLQVAQNYTGNKSFWAELDGAGGGYLQMNWNSGAVVPNANSSYSDATTASLDIVNGAIVYRTAAHSLTATGEGGDGENKIWQLGSERLRFWNQWGTASFGPLGMEIYDSAGNNHWYTTAADSATRFRIVGSAGDGTRGAVDLTPGYINFYNEDWSLNQSLNISDIASGKALLNHVHSASAEWGKTYTGISPIIVDNTARTIDISGYGLSGINVNIWKDDVHHVIVISAATGNYTTGSI